MKNALNAVSKWEAFASEIAISAREHLSAGGSSEAPDTLKRFVGAMQPEMRRDLLHDEEAIEAVVAPRVFPVRAMAQTGGHSLMLM